MTSTTDDWPLRYAALTVTLWLAVAAWVATFLLMRGMMDMGVATRLGSFTSFAALWMSMTAAMMLPAAAPAVVGRVRADGRARDLPLFLGAYLAIWALVGVAVFALYRPHGSLAAGLVVIAAGLYELTPLKARFRCGCRERVASGFELGRTCVGSCIGLMLVLLALGVMSMPWMCVISVIVVAQRLLPANVAIDAPLALALVGLGVLIVIAPSAVPGLVPAM
jgi:predicted metal-binding membrane protein